MTGSRWQSHGPPHDGVARTTDVPGGFRDTAASQRSVVRQNALTQVINEIDIDAIVQREAHPAIEAQIKSAVGHAAHMLTRSDEFQSVIYNLIQKKLVGHLDL